MGFELVVEERIREAIREGTFDDLPGAGKPLVLDDDRMVPEDLRMAFRILKNSGLVPPELETRKEAVDLRRLIEAGIEDDAERRRALTRLALIETALEARGGRLSRLPRTSPYYDQIVERFTR
ncbi:MAG TPA: DnaJ family domain-containing protein [Casimicrobiaceae bacterium]